MQNAEFNQADTQAPGVLPLKEKRFFFTTLLVDARSVGNRILDEFFKAEEHFFLRATSAEDALEKTRQFQPELILLTSELNGRTSLDLLGALLLARPRAAVIVLATDSSVDQAVEAMKKGAADYYEMPLQLKKLKQAIDLQKMLFKI